ncbi:hypothetical protein QCA50_003779 [Cerrena zonata]|uniref:Uncharacterized protein n=1 Tax=Cerrena zonata TaxID=2478898 RepID=A0AAW0GFM4_9APHY
MTNWEAGHTQAVTNFMYRQTIMFIAGLYVYEYMCTFWFDWYLVTRKIVFKWPYVPYLVGRYLILLVLCGLIAINNITRPLNCEVVMPFLITAGLIAGACATCNLMIRTVVMWGHRREIVFVLILLSLGQVAFSVYAGTSLVKSHFCTTLRTCNVDYSGHTIFSSVFVYTVSYEFLVLVLTWIRVSKSSLMATLRSQGLWYFLLTFMVNLPAAVFPWLDLNDTMNMMFYTPGWSQIEISIRKLIVVPIQQRP